MTLSVTYRFYVQKVRHFAKRKTFCVTFLYLKTWTLCITRFFIDFFLIDGGWGAFLFAKNNALCVKILNPKNNTPCVTF